MRSLAGRQTCEALRVLCGCSLNLLYHGCPRYANTKLCVSIQSGKLREYQRRAEPVALCLTGCRIVSSGSRGPQDGVFRVTVRRPPRELLAPRTSMGDRAYFGGGRRRCRSAVGCGGCRRSSPPRRLWARLSPFGRSAGSPSNSASKRILLRINKDFVFIRINLHKDNIFIASNRV